MCSGHAELTICHVPSLLRMDIRSVEFRNRQRRRDGTYRWIEWSCQGRHGLVFSAGRDITSQVEAQTATLAKALAAGPRAQAPTWAGLSPEDHATRVAELTQWVDGMLRPSYPDSAPAACWPHHWQAIWELSTLAAEWRRIYQRPAPDLAGALDFHDRWLPGVARRLTAIQADCITGRCMATDSAQKR